jgi:ribonucleotide monophosphatase NagD (HAD superfamily)
MAIGVLLDIDGVLTISREPLPGAVETIGWLLEQRIEVRLVTNTSSKSRREIAGLLAEAGMPVGLTRILTAVTSAANYLSDSQPGAGCLVLNEGDLREDLEGVELVDAGAAEVVLLGGAGPSVGYAELDAAGFVAARPIGKTLAMYQVRTALIDDAPAVGAVLADGFHDDPVLGWSVGAATTRGRPSSRLCSGSWR